MAGKNKWRDRGPTAHLPKIYYPEFVHFAIVATTIYHLHGGDAMVDVLRSVL